MDGTALILCEGAFGLPDGKTANGLVRYTERYLVLGVIDSRLAGGDAGNILDGVPNNIPIFASIEAALTELNPKPDYAVIGIAPDGGLLPFEYRCAIVKALRLGINVDCGLHTFLGDDAEFVTAAKAGGARIRDVRKPPRRDGLHFWSGKIREVAAKKVVVLGTDSAIGKRTTALLFHKSLQGHGIKSAIVGTGQTSWFQGIPHTIVMDSIVNDFVVGELEHITWQAWRDLNPDVIIIEGQGCLTHPAYPGGFEIMSACRPDAIILQHAPAREFYDGFPEWRLAGIGREIAILKLLTPAPVIAITINHEKITDAQIDSIVAEYEAHYGVPVCDPLKHGCAKLISALKKI